VPADAAADEAARETDVMARGARAAAGTAEVLREDAAQAVDGALTSAGRGAGAADGTAQVAAADAGAAAATDAVICGPWVAIGTAVVAKEHAVASADRAAASAVDAAGVAK